MPAAIARWLPRVAVALFVMAASVLAWREGGGADARRPPPHAEVAGSPTPQAPTEGHGVPALEVKRRLLDALSDARIDAPSLAAAEPFMQPYWRKMRAPWTRLEGQASAMALTLAIRTSREAEKQLSVAVPGSDSWVPQARVWNMNEGSFDQREALFAPTPATLAFRLDVPPAARLRLSPAVLTGVPFTTVFEVSVLDASGTEQPVSTTRIAGTDARTWVDVDADLARWGGQRVELRLKTSADKPGPDETTWAPAKVADDALDDAGAPERMPAPPMSLALWGDPVVVAREPAKTPYNVLWIVVDALRPDVAASLHDPAEDAAKLAAQRPPLDALLPAIPGLMPTLDSLAARGVRFTHAWSAATWTRAGTLAMLAGERSSEAGDRHDGVDPPACGRCRTTTRRHRPCCLCCCAGWAAGTAAFVNNFFMAGYVPVGVDMGFERVTDHRYRTRDTDADHARRDSHGCTPTPADRFFLFVNYNSPHEPYDPPRAMLARVPPAAGGAARPAGARVHGRGREGRRGHRRAAGPARRARADRSTLVIVTADHGETLSTAHDGEGLGGHSPALPPRRRQLRGDDTQFRW